MILSLLTEHLRRVKKSLTGFGFYGTDWLFPFLAFTLSPVISRFLKGRIWKFRLFSIRTDKIDLYAFANVFEDYPLNRIREALPKVAYVLDAGANVGAFSRLIVTLGDELRLDLKITAVEPAEDNIAMLSSQPFADSLEIIAGAVGPAEGTGSIQRGINSVAHTVTFDKITSDPQTVVVRSLQSLCKEPTLLKMDIEGGEYLILKHGLPDTVHYLLLEWHPSDDGRPENPTPLLQTGNWHLISHDLYGASMWFWEKL